MFDLFRSRDKAVRILLGVILGVVAISMVGYLIPGGWLGDQASASSDTLATVAGQKITVLGAQQQIANVVRNRNLPPEMMKLFAPQILQGLITQRAMTYEAHRLGLDVSDADLAYAIRLQLPAQLVKDGVIDKELYARVIADQGLTVPQFESEFRDQVLVSRLQRLEQEGIVVSPAEIEQEYRRRNEKVKIEYVLIPPASVQSAAQPTDADIQSYYEKNRASFKTPEKRGIALLIIDPAKLPLNTTDEALQAFYNSQKDRFRVPERVKVRHILLKTDPQKKDDAAIEAKAQALLDQIRKGGDFAALAKANSQDPGSAVKGGELDWIVKGQTVPEFEKAAFALKPNQISGLVKTTYGYHILQSEGHEDAHVKPFSEVKDQVAADYRSQQLTRLEQQLADKSAAALKKDPLHPENAVIDPSEQVTRLDNYAPGEPIAGIGVSNEIDQALTGLHKGEATGPVALAGSKIALAAVTDVNAPHPASLAEVSGQIRSQLLRQNTERLLNERAADLVAKARQMNGDLAKAAQSMGLTAKTSTDFDRNAAVEGLGSASLVADAFIRPEGSLIGPINAAEGRAVAKVISHTPPDMNGLAAQKASLSDELKSKVLQQRTALFEEGIRARLEKEGKIKINKDALNRLLQSYRS